MTNRTNILWRMLMVVAAIATSTLYASASDEVTVTPLITSAGQFSSNASDETEGTNFNNLIDNNVATFWQSNWHVGNTSITSAHYLQVAYLISDKSTIDREFGNLLQIEDNYPKYVVSLNPMLKPQDYKGINHLTLRQFLTSDEL